MFFTRTNQVTLWIGAQKQTAKNLRLGGALLYANFLEYDLEINLLGVKLLLILKNHHGKGDIVLPSWVKRGNNRSLAEEKMQLVNIADLIWAIP